MKVKASIYVLVLLSYLPVSGQVEFPVGSALMPEIESWYEINVDSLQVEVLRTIGQVKDQPYQFAVPVPVSLTPLNAGFIVTRDNETIWVMPVSSKGALSVNLILSPFNLPRGAYIYVYDSKKQVVRGAYTSESGTNNLTMPLMPLPGDRLVLECHFPGKTIPPDAIGIKQVAHDFAGFFGLEGIKDLYYGRSDVCEVDLSCSTNVNYLQASRSVVRLLVAGSELCTGVLVNNTGSEYKAYVLTANHCIDTATLAANTIFVFNYISPWCDGPDLTNMHSVSGSIFRAGNAAIDFSLVELNQFPSLVYKPYFAGWDITPAVPSNTFTLHHPEGDVMKITIDDNAPISTSYPLPGYVSNSFWRVLRWEMGTTEPGSSGGPLFDQNGRVRGTLTGGSATCDEPSNDFYAKLSRMFNITTVTSTNLKSWLDPQSTGATIVSGRDPYAYNLSRSDTLKNIPASDPGITDSYNNPGWGYSTGHNSDGLTRYAEYINYSGTGEIAWVKLSVAYASTLTQADSLRVFIWSGGAQPGSVIASRMFRIREATDNYELEVDFGRTIKVTGSYYVGYAVYYKNGLTPPQPQFAVRHSAPWPLSTQNTAWFHNGSNWRPFTQHPSFPMATSLAIKVIMVENSVLNGIDDPQNEVSPLKVFPNPFTTSLSFSIEGTGVTETTLRLYDNAGRVVSAGEYRNVFPGVLTLELPWLSPGIYHYGLKNDSVTWSGTLIKLDSR
ncbi:MAG: trypsin-like peptidase domain-containing protein [Bacteroidales bacterium]